MHRAFASGSLVIAAAALVCGACGTSNAAAPQGVAGATQDGGRPDGAGGASGTASDAAPEAGAADGQAGGAPLQTVTFLPTDAVLLNPERGFFDFVDLTDASGFDQVRQEGMSLAYAGVHLDAYRTTAIEAAFLTLLGDGFGRVRDAGIKVVLRFVYNDAMGDADASRAQILEHIAQLQPVLAANADVIAVLQSGFIGAWGEWHSSSHGLDNAADRKAIEEALLAALPSHRMVQIRTPMFKQESFGGPMADNQAFDGSSISRIGHHNDCLLATEDDMGTYEDPIETWKAYVAQEGRFTPVGGETCAVNPPRSACPSATAEMQQLHWSLLNARYHPDVISGWETGGCIDEIRRRLGYRIVLKAASLSSAVAPGGVLTVAIELRNEGWASFYNPRPVYLVLQDGTRRLTAKLGAAEPRRWEPGQTIELQAKLRVPADAAPGAHRLALWLPDGDDGLKSRPEYSVQVANEGLWNAEDGDNELTSTLFVDPDAPGPVDAAATQFAEIP